MDGWIQQFRIEPSRHLLQALCVLHLLAMAALPGVDLPLSLMALLWLMVACSLAWQLRGYCMLRRHGGTLLQHDAAGWRIVDQAGSHAAQVLPDTTHASFGMVLRLRTDAGVRTLCFARDSMDVDAFRRLRALLVLCGATQPGTASLTALPLASRRG